MRVMRRVGSLGVWRGIRCKVTFTSQHGVMGIWSLESTWIMVVSVVCHRRPSQTLKHTGFNFSHHINELSFGPYFPLLNNPLDNTASTTPTRFQKYQYYLSIVPTIYTDAPASLPALRAAAARSSSHLATDAAPSNLNSKHTIHTNQYAVTEQSHAVSEAGVPGIFFKYDIEPILLTVAEEWGGFVGLLIRCVNVIAGVLVAGGWLVSLGEWGGEVARKGRRRGSVGIIGKEEKRGMEAEGGEFNGNGGGHARSMSYGVSHPQMGGPYGGYDGGGGGYSPYGTPKKE